MRFLPLLLALALVANAAGPAAASYIPLMDYYGYGWEEGGFLPSDPGDVLEFTCSADNLHPIVGVDLGDGEVTIHVHDLVSTGQTVDGFGNTVVAYDGGMMEVYFDPALNADWGTFPPNATSPATFTEGQLLFQGAFTYFTAIFTSTGSGIFEGSLDGLGGDILGAACTDCAYTWGGAFTQDTGAQIPDGYDLQVDGTLEVDEAVPTEESSWGAIRTLYSR